MRSRIANLGLFRAAAGLGVGATALAMPVGASYLAGRKLVAPQGNRAAVANKATDDLAFAVKLGLCTTAGVMVVDLGLACCFVALVATPGLTLMTAYKIGLCKAAAENDKRAEDSSSNRMSK